MNYKRIYFKIIRNRLNNPLPKEVYGENHHIIPRSFGGSNRKSNLVRLTAREHYLAHFLLYKIFKQRVNTIFSNSAKETSRFKKMTLAFQMMLDASSDNQQRHYGLINSKVFEQLRIDCAIASSDLQKKYSSQYVKELFDFFINNRIKADTIEKLNYHFKTDFKYSTLTRLFRKYNLKLSNYDEYDSKFKSQYSSQYVKELFDFFINNKIKAETIEKLNYHFKTDFKYSTLIRLFRRENLKLSNYDEYNTQFKSKYSSQYVKELFDFFINNKIKAETIEKLNYHFKTDFKYLTLTRLFRRYNFKLSNSDEYNTQFKSKYSPRIYERTL